MRPQTSTTRDRLAGLRAGLCLALISMLGACDRESGDIRFSFAPPEELQFDEFVDETIAQSVGARSVGRLQIRTTYRTVVSRPSNWKFLFAVSLPQLTIHRNGREIVGPHMDAARQATFRIEVLDDGSFVSADGLYELVLSVTKALRGGRKASGGVVRSEVVRLAEADWRERLGFLAGKRARIGDILTTTSEGEFPTGSLHAFRHEIELTGWDDCGPGRCVWLSLRDLTDPEVVEELAGKPVAGLERILGPEAAGAVLRDLWVEGDGKRLIDPDTLLIHAETRRRTFGVELELPGRGVVDLRTDTTRSFRYHYPEPE